MISISHFHKVGKHAVEILKRQKNGLNCSEKAKTLELESLGKTNITQLLVKGVIVLLM